MGWLDGSSTYIKVKPYDLQAGERAGGGEGV